MKTTIDISMILKQHSDVNLPFKIGKLFGLHLRQFLLHLLFLVVRLVLLLFSCLFLAFLLISIALFIV